MKLLNRIARDRVLMPAIPSTSRYSELHWGVCSPGSRAAGLIVASAPFVVEYIYVAANSARCSDVKSSATEEPVFSAERVAWKMSGLKLHEHSLQVRICTCLARWFPRPYRELRRLRIWHLRYYRDWVREATDLLFDGRRQ
jgi:hypothetical protein